MGPGSPPWASQDAKTTPLASQGGRGVDISAEAFTPHKALNAPLLGSGENSPGPHSPGAHVAVAVPGGGGGGGAGQGERQQAGGAPPDNARELQGLALNALSTVFGAGMSLFAKISGGQGISVFFIVLTRSLILLAFTGPDLLRRRLNPFADPRRRWLLVLRGVLGFLSVTFLYLAVGLLPLADASVLSFLSPIFVAALSPIILGELSSRGVLMGIPVAMLGVVLVAQPPLLFGGAGNISMVGVVVGVCQALFNSLARMTVRALSVGSKEPISSIIFGQGAISTLGAAIMCTATGRFQLPARASSWGPLLIGGFLGWLYQVSLTAGLQRARAAPAVAMSYLSIIWGLLADLLIFHNAPNALSICGSLIIVSSSFFIAFNQKREAAQKAGDKADKAAAGLAGSASAGGSPSQLELGRQPESPGAWGSAPPAAAAAAGGEDEEDAAEGRPLLGPGNALRSRGLSS